MFTRFLSTTVAAGLLFAVAAAPLRAQDTIEPKVQMCNACHGQNGMPPDPKTTPIIWGQQVSFLFKQLSDYRNRTREHPIMAPIAQSLERPDLRPIAAYFAAKTWPAKAGGATPAPAAPPDEKIAVCKACHQPNFEGGPPAPRLAGLSYEYLKAQMDAFANGTRTNNMDMPPLMKALSESDRDQIAHYLAAL
jgi:cytochrome c553